MKKLTTLLLFAIIAVSKISAQENPLNTVLEDIYDKDQFARKKLIEFEQKAVADSVAYYHKLMVVSDEQNSKTVFEILDKKGWPDGLSQKANDAIFNELLKQSIKSDGIINLFSDIQQEFSLFDPKFLEEIAQMKEKNFAVELLRKLIAEQVRIYQRTNAVRADRFSDILSRAMSNYLKGMLTNEEVIETLLNTAREIMNGENDAKTLNLSDEELAFYDALTKPEAVKDFYDNKQLVAITRELTETLRANKTIDWNEKESARAGMRRIVKRLLKKYKYPPEGQDDALEVIMRQCNMWSENH